MFLYSKKYSASRFRKNPNEARYHVCPIGVNPVITPVSASVKNPVKSFTKFADEWDNKFQDFDLFNKFKQEKLNVQQQSEQSFNYFDSLYVPPNWKAFYVDPYQLSRLRASLFSCAKYRKYLDACGTLKKHSNNLKITSSAFTHKGLFEPDFAAFSKCAEQYKIDAKELTLNLLDVMSKALLYVNPTDVTTVCFDSNVSEYSRWFRDRGRIILPTKGPEITHTFYEDNLELENLFFLKYVKREIEANGALSENANADADAELANEAYKFVLIYEVWKKMATSVAKKITRKSVYESLNKANLLFNTKLEEYLNAQVVSNWNFNIKPQLKDAARENLILEYQTEIKKKLGSIKSIEGFCEAVNFQNSSPGITKLFDAFHYRHRFDEPKTYAERKIKEIKLEQNTELLQIELDLWFDLEFVGVWSEEELNNAILSSSSEEEEEEGEVEGEGKELSEEEKAAKVALQKAERNARALAKAAAQAAAEKAAADTEAAEKAEAAAALAKRNENQIEQNEKRKKQKKGEQEEDDVVMEATLSVLPPRSEEDSSSDEETASDVRDLLRARELTVHASK